MKRKKTNCINYIQNYGMSIYKVDGIKSGQLFICVATAANPCALAVTEAEEKTLPVLLLVLAYIYMKGGQLSDRELFAHYSNWYDSTFSSFRPDSVLGLLEKCDIRNAETGEPHPLFGDVRKLVLDVFVKQLYLRKTKQTLEGSNDSQLTLEWGQRAELEFARRDVLEAVAKLMNRSADSFVRQHEELLAAEETANSMVE